MIQFILRRLLVALPVLLLVSLISASIMQLVPGDPAAIIAGQNASDVEIAQIREQLGLEPAVSGASSRPGMGTWPGATWAIRSC